MDSYGFIVILCLLGISDATSVQVSNGLVNNGNVSVNFRPMYSSSLDRTIYGSCSWILNAGSPIGFYGFNCLDNSTYAPSNVTCAVNTTTLYTTFYPPPVTASVTVTLQCSPALSSPTVTLTAKYCGNVAASGVVQDVRPNQGYNSPHVFQCMTGYVQNNQSATCGPSAEWTPSPTCTIITTTPAATTTSAGATAFGSFWNGTPLVMLFVSVVCNHI